MDGARYIVQTGPEAYELRERPLPGIGADDALLAVEACGICGTDIEVFEGRSAARLPLVPGHEPVGRVVAIGAAARARWRLAEGDRVAVHSTLTCGRCRTCRAGLRGCTAPEFADGTIYGFRSPDVGPGLWGGFATHLYLAPEAILVPVSGSVSVAAASLFNVLANGVDWALDLGGARYGTSVAILGPGPRGLASVIAASAAGAGPIAVTGLAADRERLDLALELGADHAIDVTDESAAEAVPRVLGEAPDIVIDTTPGSLASVTDAVRMAGRKGTVVLAGLKGADGLAPFPVDLACAKSLTVKGAVSRSLRSMEQAVALIESGRWPLERFASHAYPLERAEDALRALMSDEKPVHARIEPSA
ncbi:zinc-dependent alcohol dehydrogenase [Actinomadura chibensis]|uniref:Alcohol dehydrogenase catalytic domain-containing protein n=1 Tax=Actinomadura chibensis TaxID=392828 RepID=A0A5D0NDD2_9ACTN|nr:alcohol dehydrogenase catalytic domain-containing protein [Actinomadura chibensis]TYB42313.1 alcohol dehydrogenase catalytic domain-containing protein [Actinomadura chibensis]